MGATSTVQTTSTLMCTWTLFTHLSARRGIRSTSSLMPRNQREVICTHSHLTLTSTSLYYHHHRVAHPTSRDCACMTSLLQSGSICRRESVTQCTHTRTQKHIYCMHQHAQKNLSSQHWILFLTLLISISPNYCHGGACANAHP